MSQQARPVRRAKISAVGCYVPKKTLTNADLETLVETNDEWIYTRTGIRKRHIAEDDQATSDLATQAAKIVLAESGTDAADLDAILVCTVTPDMLFPSTACLVQKNIGAGKAWGFDLVAACSGLLYGLTTASQMIATGVHEKVLVIGADTMSRIVDYEDRATCVLFGDGAGAFLVEPSDDPDAGLIDFLHQIDGDGGDYLKMPAGGSRRPASHDTIEGREHYVHQDGRQVFRYAVTQSASLCEQILTRNGVKPDELALLVPHQANRRIIEAVSDRVGLRPEQAFINIDRYGNTTGGTIPLATRDALAEGRIHPGDWILMMAVGAGFTSGVALWRWS